MKNQSNLRPLLELHFAMLCIGTSGALGRFIALPPPLTIWWRALFALLFLGIYCQWKGFSFRLGSKRDSGLILGTGVLMAAHWVTYFYALQLSNVAIGMLSLFTYPVMTALLEPLILKTRLYAQQLLLAALVLLGIFFLVPNFDLSNNVSQGLLIGLLSAFVYSIRNIILKTKVSSFNGSILMFYQMLVTIVLLSPVLHFYSSNQVNDFLFPIITLGLVTTAIGHTLFLNSFKHFSVSTASIMSSVQPIYGIIIAVIFLQEYPSWQSLIGGGLILLAVVLEQTRAKVQ
ncbi:MAG: DMT family transporter [Bacteroidota bacterium]